MKKRILVLPAFALLMASPSAALGAELKLATVLSIQL